MFDVDAACRRFGTLAVRSRFLVSQFKSYCVALKCIRRGSSDVEDLLCTVFILRTMGRTGSNSSGRTPTICKQFCPPTFVARHHQWLAEGYYPAFTGVVGSRAHDGHELALETPDERNYLIRLVLPYVVMSFKYPDNHLVLPLPDEWERDDIVNRPRSIPRFPFSQWSHSFGWT
ncbi:hypothetical protein EDB89DRAFT_841123 [Lactarius sanguifluus]|nr:hypothetical protein EDB89DRAFT_841123 [Lactarius sanguifluus]